MPWRRLFAALAAVGVAASISVGAPVAAVDPALPVRLTIAAPLTAPAGETGLITAEALEQYTSPFGLLSRQLDAMYGRPVAIAIDPMIIASIRVLGTSAPPSALAWLDRLSTVPNQVFPLAYADADLTLATQAGAATVPVPTSFSGLDPALFGGPPADEPDETPSPSPTPTEPPDDGTPTLDEVLAWPYTVTTLAWPREDTVVAADLPALAASGYESVVVSSTNLSRDPSATPTADCRWGHRAGQRRRRLGCACRRSRRGRRRTPGRRRWTGCSQPSDRPPPRSRVTARPCSRRVDRGVPVVGSRLAETLDALEASGAIISLPLTMALAADPDEAEIVDEAQAPDRVVQTRLLLSADAEERQFAIIAEDPEAIAGPRRLALLGILSNAWAANPTGWSAAATTFLQGSTALVSAVRVEATSQVNFFAEKSVIPIPITNDLAETVTVFVTIDPDTPLLAVEDSRVEITVPPNSQASAQVPVQAISNGQVSLTVSLSSAAGTGIGPSRLVQVNVVAGWEGPVFTVLAVLVVAFFAFGIVRTILRRRKEAVADD